MTIPHMLFAVIDAGPDERPWCEAYNGCRNLACVVEFNWYTEKLRPLCLIHAGQDRKTNRRIKRMIAARKETPRAK